MITRVKCQRLQYSFFVLRVAVYNGAGDIMKLKALFLNVLLLVSLLLASCNAPTVQPSLPPVQSPVVTRAPSSVQTPRPVITPIVTPASDIITLTWWMPEFISPQAPAPAGPLVAKHLADFEAAHNGKVRVAPVLKARYGKGGLLDFLRTTQPVAPSLLPDLIALDVAEVEQALSLGLLQPIDTNLAREITPTLYTFARQAGQFDGRVVAIPFAADLEHLIYNRDAISQPPSTWARVLAEKISYLFPVASPQSPSVSGVTDDLQNAVLGQYFAAGGTFDPKTRRPVLQEQPLLRLLTFYRDAREAGLLPENILNSATADDAWTAFTQGDVVIANVSARRYLIGRDALSNAGYAPAPGWSNFAPSVIGSSWAFAITTPDPVRQKAAAELIVWLTAPGRVGPWTQAAGWLPTSPKALATWGVSPYNVFLDDLLASAIARPIGPEYAQTAVRLQKAVVAVLKGASSPAEAVQAALSPK